MAEKVRVRKLEERGRTTGYQVDYGDGRTAAVVRPDTIRASISVTSGQATSEAAPRPRPIRTTSEIRRRR